MTRLIIIRHGQTLWNLERKYQGHSDIALSDKGIKQAEAVAARLAKEKIDAVYASDLSRACKTAEYIAARHNLKVNITPELREIKFGEWEGLTYDQITARWPGMLGKLWTTPDELEIPGGESFHQLKERAYAAIQKIIKEHPGQTVAVVAHGGTIGTILCAVLDIHLNHVWSIKQDNTAVNIIEYYDGRPVITLLNCVRHLENN
ncbi:alpha-ribazole phosphatase [Sporomusa acidovorans]|uniref:Alpha-ribazole phosphatase n=1 Tax=Sporomusa acidovorans (strain ATCC 49682 / DSM 3132 / Mol) TaxID=1123286 RepID=A0ABZ3J128_SPOA4|nr:alpha-ribazole phosphatase [Sporomusa acidovorans]OZC15063.1 phosphoserine phosphatase 1 [Sporomusa acidovorans DSM 3132]SDE84893.1 alpha-ribazole phosphatase [Sporomusa acidovorans]